MKKIIMALAIIASTVAMASVDVYAFRSTIKFPVVGKTSFVPATSAVTGTLTIDQDSTNSLATLVVTVKKTKETYTLVADATPFAVLGKKNTDCSTEITFTNVDEDSDGLVELTFSGWGTIKTKKTGSCTPCGDTTTICSKATKLTGVVIGKYACPCGGTFVEWDGSCDLDTENKTAEVCPIKGSTASFVLKRVDGRKW